MSATVKYSYSLPGEKRKHYAHRADIEILLARLPREIWARLRAVHFNDRGLGSRRLGYVNRSRREIALCALPPRVSLSKYLVQRSARSRVRGSPRQFGAIRGVQWPETAVRRFMLYDVFLHELGHLQIVDPKASTERRRFASQTKAQEFANQWRTKLWLRHFEHPDPIHNRASETELELLEAVGQGRASLG